MNYKVSILIPCYNAVGFIAQAIESALAQTWPHIEVIVVDDGSTDSSAAIVERYSSRNVQLIVQKNAGQCAAANRALKVATGDYIKFFDADDLLHPQMIERQLARLNGSNSSIASAGWGRFYADDLSSFKLNRQSVWRDMDARVWLVESWMDARPMMQCALWLIPRQILEQSGGWDEELSLINDFEFFARVLCCAESIRFTSDVPLMYRSGLPGSLSGRKSDAAIASAYRSLTLGTGHLLDRRTDSEARRACANMLQDFIYTFYPRRPDLLQKMAARIVELGGSDLPPSGPPNFQRLRRLVGWKLARRIQRFVGR